MKRHLIHHYGAAALASHADKLIDGASVIPETHASILVKEERITALQRLVTMLR